MDSTRRTFASLSHDVRCQVTLRHIRLEEQARKAWDRFYKDPSNFALCRRYAAAYAATYRLYGYIAGCDENHKDEPIGYRRRFNENVARLRLNGLVWAGFMDEAAAAIQSRDPLAIQYADGSATWIKSANAFLSRDAVPADGQ